jgi:hypothetical protein
VRLLSRVFGRRVPTEAAPTRVTGEAENEAPSLNLVYDQAIRSLDLQHSHIASLDTKAGFVLSAASVVIGFQGLLGVTTGLGVENPWWLSPAFAVYFVLLCAIFQAYRVREFTSNALDITALRSYIDDQEHFTRRQFVATFEQAHKKNEPIIDVKTKWLQGSEYLLASMVALLFLGTLLDHHHSAIVEFFRS